MIEEGENKGLDQFLAQCVELNPDALLFDGFNSCIIGFGSQYSKNSVFVYDDLRMVDYLVENEDMSVEEAMDYLSFNTWGAWMGDNTPIVIRSSE
jgi:hypothetical protein